MSTHYKIDDYKFRGLNGDKTEWIYANLRDAGWLFEQNGVWKDTVGQFTGLQDKNGKDIYEGDLIACTKEKQIGYEEVTKRYVTSGMGDTVDVHYSKETVPKYAEVKTYGEVVRNNDGRYYIKGCSFVINSFSEVCGNKWDNPELLEEA